METEIYLLRNRHGIARPPATDVARIVGGRIHARLRRKVCSLVRFYNQIFDCHITLKADGALAGVARQMLHFERGFAGAIDVHPHLGVRNNQFYVVPGIFGKSGVGLVFDVGIPHQHAVEVGRVLHAFGRQRILRPAHP